MTGKAIERVVLVGVHADQAGRIESEECLKELSLLSRTAGGEVVDRLLLRRERPRPATFVGVGQIDRIRSVAEGETADLVIFDEDLSPAQQRNLEHRLEMRVMDRAGLILDIFAARARTRAGKLQVNLAQMEYWLPRLTRLWTHLSRLGGGIGTRGPGETQLEIDRRVIRRKIHRIRRELDRLRRHRKLHRRSRRAVPIPTVALVGYTNAGKSTLLRALTGTETLIEDRLFATLDPLTRRLRLPRGGVCLLTDTVGFIRKLPHQLVEAFKATLEELLEADLLVHVVDSSHPRSREQMEAVEQVLTEIGAAERPRLTVYNKLDLLGSSLRPPADSTPGVSLSALTGQGLPALLQEVEARLGEGARYMSLLLPLGRGDLLARLTRRGRILERRYAEEGVWVRAEVPASLTDELLAFHRLPDQDLDTPEAPPNNGPTLKDLDG